MAAFSLPGLRSRLELIGIILLAVPTLQAGQPVPDATSKSKPEKFVLMNCGARIECVTPDGQAGQVSKLPAQDPGAIALIMEDDTVTCLLQEGKTDFVIEIPQAALLDRFTFLNENAVARGELKIAVSNHRLRADSPEWTEVEGIIPFSHKRLFGVSLLGIEAKFVRLSFRVEKQGRIAAVAKYGEKNGNPKDAAYDFVQAPETFQVSAMNDALNSMFATQHARDSVLLTVNSASVGPLSRVP